MTHMCVTRHCLLCTHVHKRSDLVCACVWACHAHTSVSGRLTHKCVGQTALCVHVCWALHCVCMCVGQVCLVCACVTVSLPCMCMCVRQSTLCDMCVGQSALCVHDRRSVNTHAHMCVGRSALCVHVCRSVCLLKCMCVGHTCTCVCMCVRRTNTSCVHECQTV